MMQGIVDQSYEATIRLVVGNADSLRQTINAVIDTGFTGFLTLPLSMLTSLNLRAYRREAGTLGDGSTCTFDASETTPLVGMSLLYGYRVQLDTIEGGAVTIQSLNSLS